MEPNLKCTQILAASRELFWKYGFKRITVEEICLKANVSKMTFYKFFPDKLAVAKAVFEQQVQLGISRFRDILKERATSEDKIAKILRLKIESDTIISKEFLQDFYSSEKTELREYVNQVTERSWKEIIKDFKQAQRKGIFRKDFKPEFIFLLAQKLADAINDEKLLALYKSPGDLLMELSSMFC